MNTYTQFPNTAEAVNPMETASMTLALIALVSCLFPYISLPCGALSIILATLSRGGQMQYGTKALAGIIIGTVALSATILLYTTTFIFIFAEYGSIEAFLKEYAKLSGMDYNDLMQQIMPSTQFP